MTALLPSRTPVTFPVDATLRANRIGEVAVVHCSGDLDLAAVESCSIALAGLRRLMFSGDWR